MLCGLMQLLARIMCPISYLVSRIMCCHDITLQIYLLCSCVYREVIEMFQRIFFTGVLVVISQGTSTQIFIAVVASALYLKVVMLLEPYDKPGINDRKELIHWQLLCFFFMSLLLRDNIMSSNNNKFISVCLVLTTFVNIFVDVIGDYTAKYAAKCFPYIFPLIVQTHESNSSSISVEVRGNGRNGSSDNTFVTNPVSGQDMYKSSSTSISGYEAKERKIVHKSTDSTSSTNSTRGADSSMELSTF